MKIRFTALFLALLLIVSGCGKKNDGYTNPEMPVGSADLGDDDQSFGSSLDDIGAYDGYFEGESTDIAIECLSGTQGAYTLDGTTLTFTAISEDTVYSVSGKFSGNIVIDVGDDHKFDLEFHGFSLV